MTTVTAEHKSPLRQPVLTLTIGAFSIAAFMGVVALLSGSFGETEVRVLLTTLVVGISSVCMLCYLATSGTPYAGVGVLGQVVLALPVATGLTLIWVELDLGSEEASWQAFGIGCVLALTLAQVSLLLALAWSRTDLSVPLWGTIAIAGFLAFLLCMVILGELETEGFWRLVGVLAIIDVLGTLVTTALAKFGGGDESERPTPMAMAAELWLPEELELGLRARARETGRPPAALLTEAVRAYLDADAAR